MTGEVVLSAALRSNLLSLQRTQSNIDKVQNVLATGLKVASALDNPQSFFASQALKNRSSDLSRLLDGMGQSIQSIKQADQGVTSLSKLIDQAESLATEAQGALANASGSATITGNKVFKASAEIKSAMNIDGNITFEATDKNGEALTLTGATVAIATGETIEQMVANINAIRDDEDNQVIQASLDNDGYLKISSVNGGEIRMEFADRDQAIGLGFGNISTSEIINAASNATPTHSVTISSSPVLSSTALYKEAGKLADRSTLLTAVTNDENTSLVGVGNNANNRYTVGVNGTTYNIGTAAQGMTIQGLIDGINNHSTLGTMITASFDDATGEIKIAAKSAEVTTFQFGGTSGADNGFTALNLGFGTPGGVAAPAGASAVSYENIAFGEGAGQLAQLQKDFNDVRTQIDELVRDSGYRGTNLLMGDTLTTYFNENRTSSMAVNGRKLDTSEQGLNIGEALFSSSQAVADSLNAVRNAKSVVRDFGSLLSNGLSVIQTREDFTKSTIDNLEAGSDKLTLADQNEEGAKLLALQTRQQLGVTALSLAAQAQQSVLRLF